jgi:hypothetical protein
MKKNNLIHSIATKKNLIIRTTAIMLAAATLTVAALEVKNTSAIPASENGQSVAWYAANIDAAKAKNQLCHDTPDLSSSQDCVNALHALEISFGINRQ